MSRPSGSCCGLGSPRWRRTSTRAPPTWRDCRPTCCRTWWRRYDGTRFLVLAVGIGDDGVLVHCRPAGAGQCCYSVPIEKWRSAVLKYLKPVPMYTLEEDAAPAPDLAMLQHLLDEVRLRSDGNDVVTSYAAADALLHDQHEAHKGNASTPAFAYTLGVMDALVAGGLLRQSMREGWLSRLGHCPGHAGESWCAYCGDWKEEDGATDEGMPDVSG